MILIDATTLAEYAAASTPALKAQAVIDALANPVSVKVYDGSGTLKGTGTMATPWATRASAVITVAEVTGFAVSASGTPDANWYLRFESGARWLRGSFGLAGSNQECIWSLPTWEAGQQGVIGTGLIGVPTNAAPSLVGAPSTLSFNFGVGGTYNFSAHGADPDGDPVTYALIGTSYTGISIGASTGVLTVTNVATAAVRTLTIRITDAGGLSSDWVCVVTITASLVADFIIPVSSSARTISNATNTAYGSTTWSSLATGGKTRPGAGDVIEFAGGTHGAITLSLIGSAVAKVLLRANQSARSIISSAATWVATIQDCSYLEIDGGIVGSDYGFLFTQPSVGSGAEHLVKAKGINHHVTLRNFEADGKVTSWTGSPATALPIGVGLHDNAELMSGNPAGTFHHDLLVENFYIHNVAGEGIYAGPNWSTQAVPLKDITIRNGRVEDTGRDGVQGKAWYEGVNRIDNILCRRVGRNTNDAQAGQRLGIDITSGQGAISNCRVYDSGETAFRGYVDDGPYEGRVFNGHGPYTEFVVEMYNCLAVRAGFGSGTPTLQGNGFVVQATAASTSEPSYVSGDVCVPPLAKLYNCTAYACEGTGFSVGNLAASGGAVENCIGVDNGTNFSLRSGTTNLGNYTAATFVNADPAFNASGDDYHLTAAKPVHGASTLGVNVAATDLDGETRTLATADAGPYEYP